ncbi:MAG TPA: hypothetical protein VGL56_03105 [Fimbriimonadaceae bacterium]|jgi:hypothetical protein
MAGPKNDSRQLLVGLKDHAQNDAFAKGLGKVIGTDKDSNLLLIQIDSSWTTEQALKALKKNPEVRVALPISAKDVDRKSLASVRNHAAYLNAFDSDDEDSVKDSKANAPKADRGDFYNALAYYLERHVAFGSDHINPQAIKVAMDHKSRMPKTTIGSFLPSPSNPDSTAQASGWSFLGPNNLTIPYNLYYGTPPLSGRITAIAYDPTTSATIYAGSGGGGLWKSTNSGSTWACVSDKTPWTYPAVSSIAIDPTNHLVIYVGTGDFDGFYDTYNQGIMKSTDGGTTWTNVGTTVTGLNNEAVSHIVIDPSNHLIVTASTGRGAYSGPNAEAGNVFRSTDGGQTWASARLLAADYCSLTISPVDGTYYATAGLGQASPPLMYKSTNHGASWTTFARPDTSNEQITSIACSRVTAGLIFVLYPGSQKVYKSTNSGSTWTNISAGLPPDANNENNWSQSTYDYYLGTVPAPSATGKELLFCGLITSAYSANDGATWVDYGNTYGSNANAAVIMHNDQHQFAYAPSDPTKILIGCDGGLFNLSITGWTAGSPTIAFNSLNANLGITQFYKIAPHPTDVNQALGGAQDNASPSALTGQGGYTNWANLNAGDGGWCDWDVAQSSLLTTSDQGAVFLYDIAGTTNTSLTKVSTETVAFIAPTLFSSDGSNVYLGGTTLQHYSIASGTAQFLAGTATLTTGTLSYISVVPGDANTIYTGGNDGEVQMTSNAGTSWKEIDSGLPGATVGAIAPNPLADHDVLVGFGNTGIQHLWICRNTAAATPVWTSVSGTGSTALPDVPLSGIYRSSYNPGYTWYVGTDVGVFVTTNGGQTWANANQNLPETQVNDLKYAAGYLYAGTFGRGMWRIPIVDAVSNFTLSTASAPGGSMVYGTVTLCGVAKTGGQAVAITGNNSNLMLPASVTVPAGKASLTFEVGSLGVSANTATTITATTEGISKTVALTLTPSSETSIALLHTSVVGGNNSAITVYLTGKAPAGGFKVTLSSNNANAAVIGSITIPAQATSGSAAITTKAVTSTQTVTITATAGAVTKTATLTITP